MSFQDPHLLFNFLICVLFINIYLYLYYIALVLTCYFIFYSLIKVFIGSIRSCEILNQDFLKYAIVMIQTNIYYNTSIK
jgi:hypothetical protein